MSSATRPSTMKGSRGITPKTTQPRRTPVPFVPIPRSMPKPVVQDVKTRLGTKYARCLRTLLFLSIVQTEDDETTKLRAAKDMKKIWFPIFQTQMKRSITKEANYELLCKKEYIEQAETLIKNYRPMENLMHQNVEEKLTKLIIFLNNKTDTLPVLNCNLKQHVDTKAFKECICNLNASLRNESTGTCAIAGHVLEKASFVLANLKKTESERNFIQILNKNMSRLASLAASLNEEYENEFKKEKNVTLTGTVISGRNNNMSVDLSSISIYNFTLK